MAAKLKVTYIDGKEIEVVATPRAQVETERFLRNQGGFDQSTAVEASYRLAFESLRSRKQLANDAMGYEEWLDSIAEIDELEAEPPADPTPEAPSPTPSSD